jgi:glycerol-3-phosphate dehydrogenase (NAD(P)+)
MAEGHGLRRQHQGLAHHPRASPRPPGSARASGADPLTFAGLAGLGDLVATCTSPLSRNRTFGERLGRGETLEEILARKQQTAEGVKCCRSILDLARKHDVDMPITEHVVAVVHDGMAPRDMVRGPDAREARSE